MTDPTARASPRPHLPSLSPCSPRRYADDDRIPVSAGPERKKLSAPAILPARKIIAYIWGPLCAAGVCDRNVATADALEVTVNGKALPPHYSLAAVRQHAA